LEGRTWAPTNRLLLGALMTGAATLTMGCGMEEPAPDIETVKAPVVGYTEYSPNTPTFVFHGDAMNLSMRVGNGSTSAASALAVYEMPFPETWKVISGPDQDGPSAFRPARWWEDSTGGKWATIYREGNIVRDTAFGETSNIFPNAPSGNPVGPPTVLVQTNAFDTAYSLWSNNEIRKTYVDGNAWFDSEISMPANIVPTMAPHPIIRSKSFPYSPTDSLYFGCTGQAGVRICEHRQSNINIATFSTLVSSTGSFADGTRPTAIARYQTSNQPFLFLVLQQTGAPAIRYVLGLRETTSLSEWNPPAYAQYTIESSSTAIYSTPMPYVRSDGKEAVVYFRTAPGATTRVMEAFWNGAGFTVNEVADTATLLPADKVTEPVPFLQPVATDGSQPARDSIFFRLPFGNGHKDLMLLLRDTNGSFSKTAMPTMVDESNLFAIKPSNATLYRIAKSNGAQTAQNTDWSGTTAFATDRLGLGYAIQGDALHEINLQDGTHRPIVVGGKTWPGVTSMTFGYDGVATIPRLPRLWVIQNGHLWRVNLAGGLPFDYGTGWAGATALAFLRTDSAANALYIISNNTLRRFNTTTGAFTNLGAVGAWSGWKAMAAYNGAAGKKLYIVKSGTLYSVDPASGASTAIGAGTFTGTNVSMAVTAGQLYVTVGDASLKKVNPSTNAVSNVNTSAFWNQAVFLAPREWTVNVTGEGADGKGIAR
jgi:hypothetical protein